eukprot:2709557-Rhodomonas_salina.1
MNSHRAAAGVQHTAPLPPTCSIMIMRRKRRMCGHDDDDDDHDHDHDHDDDHDDDDNVVVVVVVADTLIKRCWGCGAAESETGFKNCPRCLEQSRQVLPAKFCSDACFKQAWPAHKEWHKAQLARLEGWQSEPRQATRQDDLIRDSIASRGDYGALLAEARGLQDVLDFRRAAKKFHKAI